MSLLSLYLLFSLSRSQFQPIFLSFVAISAILCRRFKPCCMVSRLWSFMWLCNAVVMSPWLCHPQMTCSSRAWVLSSSVVRASDWCLEGHGFNSHPELRNFFWVLYSTHSILPIYYLLLREFLHDCVMLQFIHLFIFLHNAVVQCGHSVSLLITSAYF